MHINFDYPQVVLIEQKKNISPYPNSPQASLTFLIVALNVLKKYTY